MNEKFCKLLENHGVDLSVGSIRYWQNEIEMALFEMCDEVAAEERKGCAEDYLKIMRDAVEVARRDEREVCAQLCDAAAKQSGSDHEAGGMYWCAEAIRAKGEK